MPAPLDSAPVFVRAGSIVPCGPDVQYADEKPWDSLAVVVYPGADGEFVLYEDSGDGYGYAQGAFSEIPMKWNDKSRVLTIGARRGSYPSMIGSRVFNVRVVGGRAELVRYDGRKTELIEKKGTR